MTEDKVVRDWFMHFDLELHGHEEILPEGISGSEIEAWEKEHSFVLPVFYKQIISRHNGIVVDSQNFFFSLDQLEIVRSGIIIEYIVIAKIKENLIYCDQDANIYARNQQTKELEPIAVENLLQDFLTSTRNRFYTNDLEKQKMDMEKIKNQKNTIVVLLALLSFCILASLHSPYAFVPFIAAWLYVKVTQ